MDTLKLKSGLEISFDTGKPIKQHKPTLVEVPTYREAQRQVLNVRKELSELPAPPKQMNVVSVILAYQLFGLSPTDIAIATKLTDQQVRTIQASEVYKQLSTAIKDNILNQDADSVRNIMIQQSKQALYKVVDLMESENEGVSLAASKDILDRAGHRPVDTVQHQHSMEGGLRIEIIEKKEADMDVTIDITPRVF